LAAVFLLLAPAASAVTVDNFGQGDFHVVDTTGGGDTRFQTGLSTSNVIGGTRV
jgi:hypothetical protein